MVKRNSNLDRVDKDYLFSKIAAIKNDFLQKFPEKQLLDLSIGNTTAPLNRNILKALEKETLALSETNVHCGYGDEKGHWNLREYISSHIYNGKFSPEEIFISDGAKTSLSRLQLLISQNSTIALQNPIYPAYKDCSLINGNSNIIYLPCNPENNFFPNFNNAPKCDFIFICSPNNPTGSAASFEQLEQCLSFAKKHSAIVIFDAVYSCFISSSKYPKSIFEIDNSELYAIEIQSLSKSAGFSGLRLGWTVVPKKLKYENNSSIHQDWERITATTFNGPSSLIQPIGYAAVKGDIEAIQLYKNNASLLKKSLEKVNYTVYGGVHSPYLWVKIKQKTSEEEFNYMLQNYSILTTPGTGFGSEGEGFLRISSFAKPDVIQQAIKNILSKMLIKG